MLVLATFIVVTGSSAMAAEAMALKGPEHIAMARRTFVTPQSMQAVFKEPENRKLLVRRTHPQHRRVLQAELTESGRSTLGEAADAVNAVEERMLGKLSDLARSRLAGALGSCVDALT